MRALCLLGLLLGARVAAAHPQQTSLGEAHWRGDRLELAIRVATHDLVDALARHGEDALGPQADAALGRYVVAALDVETPTGRAPVRYLGHEGDPEGTWLYAEVALPTLRAATLRHGLLAELGPAVVHTLTLYDGPRRWSLTFTAATPVLPLLQSPTGNAPAEPPPRP
ncbi:MAG: hypothetical protein H6706_27190 [Myxococcales bacterium]|nr:hypothetical protein [Myxococcales bacterium]